MRENFFFGLCQETDCVCVYLYLPGWYLYRELYKHNWCWLQDPNHWAGWKDHQTADSKFSSLHLTPTLYPYITLVDRMSHKNCCQYLDCWGKAYFLTWHTVSHKRAMCITSWSKHPQWPRNSIRMWRNNCIDYVQIATEVKLQIN